MVFSERGMKEEGKGEPLKVPNKSLNQEILLV